MIVPPYCGVPKLSHQFPVKVVVAVFVETDAVDEVRAVVELDVVEIEGAGEVVVEVGGGMVVVLVVAEEAQDANIKEIIIKKLNPITIFLLFIYYLPFN